MSEIVKRQWNMKWIVVKPAYFTFHCMGCKGDVDHLLDEGDKARMI